MYISLDGTHEDTESPPDRLELYRTKLDLLKQITQSDYNEDDLAKLANKITEAGRAVIGVTINVLINVNYITVFRYLCYNISSPYYTN